jgi:hypothetical protein
VVVVVVALDCHDVTDGYVGRGARRTITKSVIRLCQVVFCGYKAVGLPQLFNSFSARNQIVQTPTMASFKLMIAVALLASLALATAERAQ